MMPSVWSLVKWVFLTTSVVYSTTVDESSTGALIRFPYAPRGHPLHNVTWDVAPAQFGVHDYGGSLEGYIVLPKNTSFHTECTAEPSSRQNDYIQWVRSWNVDATVPMIMAIDRGDCYFVEKVENAQSLGLDGVIILDYKTESLFTMWPPDDWVDDVDIPAVLLQETYAEELMAVLGVRDWSLDSMLYPAANKFNFTVALIEWGLPHPDDRVEWELWTSANDERSVEFKTEFKSTAESLESQNKTIFQPHWYVLNGSHWRCDSGSYRCGRQCSNGGRYCSVDPEYDLTIGLDGIDVVQENLRQICLWNYTLLGGNFTLLWDYWVAFDEVCFTNDSATFTADCSYGLMDALDASLSPFVKECTEKSGGSEYAGGVNYLLEHEVSLRDEEGIYAMPTVIVNEFMIHGSLTCPSVTTQECEVLNAICAGYVNGTQPDVCYATPAPQPVTCIDAEKDCNGTCYGDADYDDCNVCQSIRDPQWNACVGCDNTPFSNKTYDCAMTCGGPMRTNPCGRCLDPGSDDYVFEDTGKDCAGTCDGDYETDECNNCLSMADPLFNKCVGCDGVIDSNKTYDCENVCGGPLQTNPCGRCLDPSSDEYVWEDEGKDCNDTCDGDAEYDDCEKCLPVRSVDWNQCIGCDNIKDSGLVVDCTGACGGTKATNDCGYCIEVDSTDYSWDTYGKDCRGICNGGYENDACGRCLEPSDVAWNACETIDDGTDTQSMQNEIDTTLIAVIVVSILALIILCVAGIIIYRMYKRQKMVDQRFSQLMSQYTMMDEDPHHASEKIARIPDQDPEMDEPTDATTVN